MIPADARKELEDRLEECIETLTANKDALIDLNASDLRGFKEILDAVDEEVESLVDTGNNCREALAEEGN